MKTNAARVLDRLGIPYLLRTYRVDPEDLSAVRVAEKVGLPAGQLEISISAGIRGMQILLSPADDVRATRAVVTEIARRNEA